MTQDEARGYLMALTDVRADVEDWRKRHSGYTVSDVLDTLAERIISVKAAFGVDEKEVKNATAG
jgi:hypothetical protein